MDTDSFKLTAVIGKITFSQVLYPPKEIYLKSLYGINTRTR